MPVILVTARADSKDIVRGLDVGGDEYVTKPIDQAALVARVRSTLRIKELHDTVREQVKRLAAQADELARWNDALQQRVNDQLGEIERMGRLRRFLTPQIAELVVSSGGEQLLEIHRRQIPVVHYDLRGFTGFSETAEPEAVMSALRHYHEAIGKLIHKYEATLERFAGDGVMVWFNDPLPCPDPCERAVRMAVEARDKVAQLVAQWRRQGYELGFGVGIAHGYATLGRIGFEGRFDYGAVGTVVNMAARLCGEAKDGQILIDPKVQAVVGTIVDTEPAASFPSRACTDRSRRSTSVSQADSPIARSDPRGFAGSWGQDRSDRPYSITSSVMASMPAWFGRGVHVVPRAARALSMGEERWAENSR